MRLSQFQPGKINRKLTSRFEAGLDSGTIIGELFKYYWKYENILNWSDYDRVKPPTKKLISLDQILLKETRVSDLETERDRELREIKQIR